MQYQIRTAAQSVITLYVIHESTHPEFLPEKKRGIPINVLQHVSELTQSLKTLWHEAENNEKTGQQHAQFYRVAHALTDILPANHTISFVYDSAWASDYEVKQAVAAGIKLLKERSNTSAQLATNQELPNNRNTSKSTTQSLSARQICLPVYYGEEVAWDLPELCSLSALSKEEIIHQHQMGNYRVSAVGFSPGFAYMQGLAATLQFPRLTHPRVQVPAGALAIAEHQTAIYPQASPAGWRIIGHCPVPLFKLEENSATQQNKVSQQKKNNNDECETLLTMGDEVTFKALEKQAYLELLYENRRYFARSLGDVFPEVLGKSELVDG